MKIEKPLLATTFDEEKAQFPYSATPKIDGIRFLMIDGQAVSRTFKPIRNKYIQGCLADIELPDGIDGELTVGDTFQDCGAIMSSKGEPDFKVWIFDYVNPADEEMPGYKERMKQLATIQRPIDANGEFPLTLGAYAKSLGVDLEVLYPTTVNSQEEVDELMVKNLDDGYEGLMLRAPDGPYKFGRSTVKENTLLKVKNFLDDEAEVIGFKEQTTNTNVKTKNVFGRSERSTSQDGMVPAGTLGGFLLKMKDGREFSCGSGLNDVLRKEIWEDRDSYLGKFVKFKYMPYGVKEGTGIPRLPIFLGFRDKSDMS